MFYYPDKKTKRFYFLISFIKMTECAWILNLYLHKVKNFQEILAQDSLSKDDLIRLLTAEGEDRTLLFKKSQEKKEEVVGRKVYFRGLVEFSNICSKDCLYCGIRKSNSKVVRYNAEDEEILEACKFAWENKFASVVLQSGELSSPAFTKRVSTLLKKIKKLSNNELGITLSCGEQSRETYELWKESGAHRYLLRIESSNPDLYYKIHPKNEKHSFENRLNALRLLKETGYQVGTGVMVGLPFQTMEDLANDLLFFKEWILICVAWDPMWSMKIPRFLHIGWDWKPGNTVSTSH